MNQTNRERMLSILDDTINYYSEDTNRRAVEQAACKYLAKNGNKCAVGRLLTPTELKEWDEISSSNTSGGNNNGYEEMLDRVCKTPEVFVGLNIGFVCELQDLHDDGNNWNGNGLSYDGKLFVEEFRDNIKAGMYD